MLYGFLIAFFIALVIGISIALVIAIALREVTDHIYEGGGYNAPMDGFRSHLRRARETGLRKKGGKKSVRHRHYHA